MAVALGMSPINLPQSSSGRLFEILERKHAVALLYCPEVLDKLPAIELFSEIPIFDQNLLLVEPGYNDVSKVYYAGDVEPLAASA